MTRAMGILDTGRAAVVCLGLALATTLTMTMAAGCLDAGTTLCASGLRCPSGSVCTQDQTGCTTTLCGNGVIDPGAGPGDRELCDDGNVISGDGCRGDCRSLELCGDATVDEHVGEECDLGDENASEGSVCSLQCQKMCTGEQLDPGEQCDYPLFGVSCLDFGFHRGTVSCSRCEPLLTGCRMIGWVREDKPGGLGDLHDVWGVNERTIFAVGQVAGRSSGAVALYDGRAWSLMAVPTTPGALLGVWSSGPADAFAVGEGGEILRYGGQAWQRRRAGTAATLRDVWSSGPGGDVLVVGHGRTALRLARDTGTWTPEPLPAAVDASVDLHGIWGSGPEDIFVVGAGGTVLHRTAGGWQREAEGVTSADLLAVWGSGPDDVFAVGAGGTILHYDGETWSSMVADTTQHLDGVWGSGPAHVFAVGRSGTILLYDGQGFRALEPDTDLHLAGVWGLDPDSFVAVGQSGMILSYQGQAWAERKPRPTSQRLHRLWAGAGDEVYALAASDPFVLRFDGRDWRAVSDSEPGLRALLPPQTGSEPPLRDIWGDGRGALYAVGAGGTILHRDAAGTWSRVALDPAVAATISAHTLTAVWGTDDGHVFVVGEVMPGAAQAIILHHDGQDWSFTPSGPSGTLLDVWGTSATDVVAVGESGTILEHDGDAWQRVALGSNQTFHGVWGNGDAFYVAGGDGAILQRTRAEWRESLAAGGHPPWHAVWGRAGADVYAVGADGTIFHLTSTGWDPVRSSTDHRLLDVWGVMNDTGSVQTLMLGGEGGTFLRLLQSSDVDPA